MTTDEWAIALHTLRSADKNETYSSPSTRLLLRSSIKSLEDLQRETFRPDPPTRLAYAASMVGVLVFGVVVGLVIAVVTLF